MIKLLASDIDGTIIDNDNQISPYNLEAIRKLNNKNVNFTLCTGKTYFMVKDFCKQMNAGYGIFGNGTQIINLKTGKDLCILQGAILSLCFKYNIPYKFYAPSSWRSVIGTYDGTRQGMKREVQKQKAVDKVNEVYNLNFIYNKTETKTKHTDDDKAEAICLALAYITERREV